MFNKNTITIIFFATTVLILFVLNSFIFREMTLEEEVNTAEKIFPTFNTVNLERQPVTNEIFFGKTTAFVIWTTQAEEICKPTLEQLNKEIKNLPANVQIIGLVGDLRSAEDEDKFSAARKIVDAHAKNFQHLAVNDDFFPVLSKVRTVPTTIFVNAQGFLISQPVIGTDASFIFRELDYILEKDSPKYKSLKKAQEIIWSK